MEARQVCQFVWPQVREARDVLGEIDPVNLLEIVARAYRKRGELQSPKTYVLACIRSARAA